MRESQYVEGYLNETAAGHLVTPGTYLAGELRGRQKQYAGRYAAALVASAKRRGAQAVTSVRGGTAYVIPA